MRMPKMPTQSLKQEFASDIYNVVASINQKKRLPSEVMEFYFDFWDSQDRFRFGEETDYKLDELKEIARTIKPDLTKADGLYERTSRKRLEQVLAADFVNLEEIYAEKVQNGYTEEDLADAFKLLKQMVPGL